MSDDPIMAALNRLEVSQQTIIHEVRTFRTGIMADLAATRGEIMARMDRLQSRMDSLDEHLTLGLGHSDRVERRAQAVTEDNRLLGEQMISLTKLLRRLESRINDLEDK